MSYQPVLLDFLPLIPCAISIVVAIMIIQRNPRFLQVEQLSYLVSAIGLIVSLSTNGLLASLIDEIGMFFALMTILLLAVLFIASISLMMLYYTRSVRLRTYMGSDEYLRRAFFTKKIKGPQPAVPDEKMPENLPEGENL